MIAENDFSPVYLGDVGAKFVPTFRHKDGTPYDLTGAALTLKMVNTSDDSVKVGAGTWTIDDAPNGKTHYQYGAADVNQVGTFTLWALATIGGASPVHADPETLEIKWAP